MTYLIPLHALLVTAGAVLAVDAAVSSMAAVDPKILPVTSDLAKSLQAHVQYLASPELMGRKPGTPGNRAAADYIQARFREAGLVALPSLGGYGQQLPDGLGDNLIGLRPASAPAAVAPYLLIGAHYDHLGGNYLGADDNASAVAILIEVARLLPPLPHHHVLFVAFNAEEPPYIRTPRMGSQHFTDHLPPEIGAATALQAVIIMDIMGGVHWEPLRGAIFAAGAEKSPALYRRLKEAGQAASGKGQGATTSFPSPLASSLSPLTVLPVGMHLVEEIPLIGQVSFSDYDAFRNRSIPFLLLSSGRTPRYHQPSDLPDTLHYERMATTVTWLQFLIALIDQDKEPYRFEPARIEFTDEATIFRPLVEKAAEWETRIPGTSLISLWRLKRDRDWLQKLNPAQPTQEDITRLERLSIRLQCLLADFPACFLL
ncbi:MAG: M28 family peptidase [Nitrospira sp.]|nr:M28 family peptidase [Nitrospira sp.]